MWYCSSFFKSIVHRVFAFGFEDVFICWAHFKNVGFVRIFKLLLIFTSKLFFMKNLTSVVIIQQKLPIECRYYLEIGLDGYNFNQKYDTCNNNGLTRQCNGYTTCLWMRSLELQGRPFKTHCWLFTSGLRRKKIANVSSELLCASVWLIVQIKREEKYTVWKVSKYWVFSGLYIPRIRTEYGYFVFGHILYNSTLEFEPVTLLNWNEIFYWTVRSIFAQRKKSNNHLADLFKEIEIKL